MYHEGFFDLSQDTPIRGLSIIFKKAPGSKFNLPNLGKRGKLEKSNWLV